MAGANKLSDQEIRLKAGLADMQKKLERPLFKWHRLTEAVATNKVSDKVFEYPPREMRDKYMA